MLPIPEIPDKEKAGVRQMFNDIAPRYDLLNNLLSFGTHRRWKRKTIRQFRDDDIQSFLDVATGTADLAILASRLKPGKIMGVDISPEMLANGRKKIKKRKLDTLIKLMIADSEVLPFVDNTFDGVTAGFGVRNFENLDKGLSEMCRVLRPGGRAVILEFSIPENKTLRRMYFLYFLHVLPFIGRLVSRHGKAYRYLPDTVSSFPSGRDFLDVMEKAGFVRTSYRPLSFGIATMYTGFKFQTSISES
jgi:demethylmenaquinone methyltransferase / 2-methoxy-6-polyprenyl-1,4-benzoquinol methylase